jgi:hypothetical protein
MPLFSDLEVLAADYVVATKVLTVTGIAFSENQYAVGKLEVSLNGSDWTEVDSYTSWADSEIVGEFTAALAAGTYQVRVTNGDNEESAPLTSAFVVAASAGGFTRMPQMAIGAYVGL